MNKDTLNPLFVRTKLGKINVWSVWADKGYLYTEWGSLGGKIQQSKKKAIATNVGKSNERNEEAQAEFEALAFHKQKKDEGYSENPETAKTATIFLPMLAHKVENLDKLKGKSFDLQPKLDGVRCLAYWENGEVQLMSRGGKSYSVPHIQMELSQFLPVGAILDGEIWGYGLSCQTVTSYVKKTKPSTEKLKYNVFDLPSSGGMWETRREVLKDYFNTLADHEKESLEEVKSIKLVETIENAHISEIDKYHDTWVSEGYEGLIVRLHDGIYQYGERSRELMKYKKFLDSEFKCVGIEPGEGKLSNAAILVCQNDLTNDTFRCIFAGDINQREEQLKNKANYINKMITVRYFSRTDSGLPRFPIAKVWRLFEDL